MHTIYNAKVWIIIHKNKTLLGKLLTISLIEVSAARMSVYYIYAPICRQKVVVGVYREKFPDGLY